MSEWFYSLISIWGFFMTIIVEFIIYLIGIRQKIGKIAFYAILINAFTWPLASLLFGFWNNPIGFLVSELLVFVVEFILIMLLFKIKWWKALIISLIANIITMFLGVFLIFF